MIFQVETDINIYANRFHPDNIPDEIKRSKDVYIWSHVYMTKLNGLDCSNTNYICKIEPKNFRKSTIKRFNSLLKKHDWPCSISTDSRCDEWKYTGVRVRWLHWMRYVDSDRKVLRSKTNKTILAKALLSRLCGPSELYLNVQDKSQVYYNEKYYYILETFYEINVHKNRSDVNNINEALTENMQCTLFGFGAALEIMYNTFTYYIVSKNKYDKNICIDDFKQFVEKIESIPSYDNFVTMKKLEVLNLI